MTKEQAQRAIHTIMRGITPRQRYVLAARLQGWTSQDIAEKWQCSVKTIESDMLAVRRMTRAVTDHHLYLLAIMAGLIEAPAWFELPETAKEKDNG